MNKETQKHTINLGPGHQDSINRNREIKSGLEKIGFDKNHIFSFYHSNGPNASRDPPAGYILQPSDKPNGRTEFELYNGQPCTREQKGYEVEEKVKWKIVN